MASERPPTGAYRAAPAPTDDFVVVYREHAGAILRYIRRRLGDSLADDATAEVFSRAYAARHTARADSGTPRPWLYGIAAHVIADHHRAETRRLRAIERFAAQPQAPASTPRTETIDPSLARSLRKLSAGDREAILLVAWGELSYDETAVALGVPVGTVRSRINRARRQLDADLRPRTETTPTSTTGKAHG